MPFVFFAFSFLLLSLGGGLYHVDGVRTVTPYVCGGIGAALLLCGLLSLTAVKFRSPALYAATAIGALGTIRGIGFSLATILDQKTASIPLATYAQFTMGVLCAVLFAICVKTIRDNRRARIPNF